MIEERITRAIVLAAGFGSRLSEPEAAVPKPLRAVAGVPLLVRVLRTLQASGIREAVVVIGHDGERIRHALNSEPSLALRLSFVENADYKKSNGVSLLAAAAYVESDVLLTMSDHLYSPELVRRVLAPRLPEGTCALGVDYDIERCFDLDDATKVRANASGIEAIGKELSDYNCIDTGVFRVGPALIRELRELHAAQGDCSLSDGVRALARRGQFQVCDVCDVRWIDVDTPAALERAEAMIRVFGESLGDEPGSASVRQDPEAVEQFAPSWVRAARPYNEDHFAIAEQTEGLARLMANENPFPPSPRVINAIVEAATLGNRYPGGSGTLKERLAAREGLAAPNVLLGSGSTELIDLVIRTFVAPGEEVLLSVPTFSMYEARTRTAGGIPVLVPMTEDGDYDLPALIRAVTERTKVVFLCSPNNPTGARISPQDLLRLLRLGLPTVIDEAYLEFGADESAARLLAEYPNALVLRTFSKAFGLAGLRLGYLMAHATVAQLLERVKIPWNIPSITIAAAVAALEEHEEFAARMTELIELRSELAARLTELPGLRVLSAEGNFVVVDVSDTGFSAGGFVSAVLGDGVLIRALSAHRTTRAHVRVSVGTAQENAACLRAIARLVDRPVTPRVALRADAPLGAEAPRLLASAALSDAE